ncbi:MAG TPA: TetR/AcrR family transcriptional regulator [Terriglobales bacterium]|nr:TetR/AcrR family transcriptional regulator [Terriglobales bacterium]
MPKIAQDRIEENQRRIEDAALALFTRQGFHGTNIREIAQKAEVSTGAIYTYYPTKEALFVSLVGHYEERMKKLRDRLFQGIRAPFAKQEIRRLAAEIRSMVYDNADYWLLMYIDVIEFSNQHFVFMFQEMPEKIRHRLGPALQKVKTQPGWSGRDPAFVFTSIYMYILQYFLIEKLFQGNRHLGVSDEQAIEFFVQLLAEGTWNSRRRVARKTPRFSGKRANGAQRREQRALAVS